MNTWLVGKDLMKPHFQIKKLFTVNYILKILLMKIHAQKVFGELKLKNLGDYHDLYVQSET